MSWAAPQAALLPDGKRLHLHHGPIDLVLSCSAPQRVRGFSQAKTRFRSILTELVDELSALRQPSGSGTFAGVVSQRMASAVASFDGVFVTPMAAVAGAVADEILAAMIEGHRPQKAVVNNGGDIAFHLADDAAFTALGPAGHITISAQDDARGIATSGWRGRSHSRGIADAVTVAAPCAALADAAATLIANAVDLPCHPAIARSPADQLNPDSDLGHRLVTTDVGPLNAAEVETALRAGRTLARDLCRRGLITSAVLTLKNQIYVVDNAYETKHSGEPAHA